MRREIDHEDGFRNGMDGGNTDILQSVIEITQSNQDIIRTTSVRITDLPDIVLNGHLLNKCQTGYQ